MLLLGTFLLVQIVVEVTELSPEEIESVTGGYGKSSSDVIIGLKTDKGIHKEEIVQVLPLRPKICVFAFFNIFAFIYLIYLNYKCLIICKRCIDAFVAAAKSEVLYWHV